MFVWFNWLSFNWLKGDGKIIPPLEPIPEDQEEISIPKEWKEIIQNIEALHSSFPISSIFANNVLHSLDLSNLKYPVFVEKMSSDDGIKILWPEPLNLVWQIIEINDPTSTTQIASVFTLQQLGEEEIFMDHIEDVCAYLNEKLYTFDNEKLNRFAKNQN